MDFGVSEVGFQSHHLTRLSLTGHIVLLGHSRTLPLSCYRATEWSCYYWALQSSGSDLGKSIHIVWGAQALPELLIALCALTPFQ